MAFCFDKVQNQRTTHSLIQIGKTAVLRKRYVPSVLKLIFVSQSIKRFGFFHLAEIAKGPEIQWAWWQKYVLPCRKVRKVKYRKDY